MGLTVNEFKILNGAVTLDTVYANVRDMTTSKNDDNIYTFSFITFYKLNNETIHAEHILTNSETVEALDSWSFAYKVLKEKLTEKGYIFTDN